MKKFAAVLLSIGLAISLSAPVMGDEMPADAAETAAESTEGTGTDGTGETGSEEGTEDPGDPEETDPADPEDGGDSSEEPDPAGEDPEETDETGDTDETGETGEEGEEDPENEDGEEEEDPDPSETEEDPETEDPSPEEETEPETEDGKPEKEDPEKEEDKDKKEDKDKDPSDKKKKPDKDKKTDKTETETKKEDDIPAPMGSGTAVVPRRIINYSVKHFKKIKPVFIRCSAEEAAVREFPDSSSGPAAAKLANGAVVRLIEETGSAWWFIETRDRNGKIVRGYVQSSCFEKDAEGKKVTAKAKEEDPEKVSILKETNAGFDAVEKTTYDELAYGKFVSGTREDVVNYALQHLGNPYAEGGRSLTGGTNGTGLAQAVYAEFGIFLPGTAEEQYESGTRITVKNARPGDLIYYINSDKKPEQVMLCLSNDKKGHIQVVQASPEAGRILITDLDWDKTCRAATFEQLNAASSLSDVEVLDLSQWHSVGDCRLTSYCFKCNTPANSAITASGVPATEWHTVAVDSSVIPLGSKVYIEGYGIFVAEDTGVKGKWCDLYTYYNECSIWDTAQVYYQ